MARPISPGYYPQTLISFKDLDKNQDFTQNLQAAVLLSLLKKELLSKEQLDFCIEELNKY